MERPRTCLCVIGFPRKCSGAGIQTPERKPEAPMSRDFFSFLNMNPERNCQDFSPSSYATVGISSTCTFWKDAALQRPGSSIPLCRAAVQRPSPRASVPVHSLTSVPATMTSALAVLLINEHLPPTYDLRRALGK